MEQKVGWGDLDEAVAVSPGDEDEGCDEEESDDRER